MPKTFLMLLIIVGSCMSAKAQHTTYEDASIDIGSSFSVLKTDFTRNWKAKPSINLAGRVSFYAGDLQLGLRFTRFNYQDFREPGGDFYSTFVYLGWGYPIRIAPRFHFEPGFRFGMQFFTYDEAKVYSKPNVSYDYTFDSQESEFSYALTGRLEYALVPHQWEVFTAFSYNRTQTYYPLNYGTISVGISYDFSSPSWLKTFLK